MKFSVVVVNDEEAQAAIRAVGGTVDRQKREVEIPDEAIVSRVQADKRSSPGGRYWNDHKMIVLSSGIELLESHSEQGNGFEVNRWGDKYR